MAARSTGKSHAEKSKRVLTKAKGKTTESRFARLRGTATVKMSTDEIMMLTRGRKPR